MIHEHEWDGSSTGAAGEQFGDVIESATLETASEYDAVLIGEPYDGGVIDRPGAREGPAAIRESLAGVETHHLDAGPVDAIGDLGSVELPAGESVTAVQKKVEEAVAAVHDADALPVFIGGDGSLTYANVAGLLEVTAVTDGGYLTDGGFDDDKAVGDVEHFDPTGGTQDEDEDEQEADEQEADEQEDEESESEDQEADEQEADEPETDESKDKQETDEQEADESESEEQETDEQEVEESESEEQEADEQEDESDTVSEDETEDESDTEDEESSVEVPFEPSERTVAEIPELVADIGDRVALEALLEAETAEKDRRTAKRHISDRIDEVTEQEEESDAGVEAEKEADRRTAVEETIPDPGESETPAEETPGDEQSADASSFGRTEAGGSETTVERDGTETDSVGVISLDSRLDCREVDGQPTNRTTYRQLFEAGLDSLVVLGARHFESSTAEAEYLRDQGGEVVTAEEVGDDPVAAADRALEAVSDVDTLYVSVDLSVLDSTAGQGVSAPAPGGITTRELFRIVRLLASEDRLAGIEVVETAPQLDDDGRTVDAAARALAHALATA